MIGLNLALADLISRSRVAASCFSRAVRSSFDDSMASSAARRMRLAEREYGFQARTICWRAKKKSTTRAGRKAARPIAPPVTRRLCSREPVSAAIPTPAPMKAAVGSTMIGPRKSRGIDNRRNDSVAVEAAPSSSRRVTCGFRSIPERSSSDGPVRRGTSCLYRLVSRIIRDSRSSRRTRSSSISFWRSSKASRGRFSLASKTVSASQMSSSSASFAFLSFSWAFLRIRTDIDLASSSISRTRSLQICWAVEIFARRFRAAVSIPSSRDFAIAVVFASCLRRSSVSAASPSVVAAMLSVAESRVRASSRRRVAPIFPRRSGGGAVSGSSWGTVSVISQSSPQSRRACASSPSSCSMAVAAERIRRSSGWIRRSWNARLTGSRQVSLTRRQAMASSLYSLCIRIRAEVTLMPVPPSVRRRRSCLRRVARRFAASIHVRPRSRPGR